MIIARRNLLKDKTRLVLSVIGVALAVMLILLLNGFLVGMDRQISSYLDHTPGSIVVAQEGVRNLLGATSFLPQDAVAAIQVKEGISAVIPILSQFVILDLHGKKQPAYLVGYDPEMGGGPWKVTSGNEPQSDQELVLDRVLAERHGFHIGDTFKVMGQDFIIVGLSDDTTSWMTSFFFIRKSAAEKLLRAPGMTSFLLVSPDKDASPKDILNQLNDIHGVNALGKGEMVANDRKLFAKIFSAPLKLMVGIAFLVGTLVVGLVIYTATVERQREYGMLKAIGAANLVLYCVVTTQALVAALAGALAGIIMAYSAAYGIMVARPQFLITLEPQDILLAFVTSLGMALAAALIPSRIVANLAPAEVFRK